MRCARATPSGGVLFLPCLRWAPTVALRDKAVYRDWRIFHNVFKFSHAGGVQRL